jgi:calcineurin-like phosphoesterase family protein
VASGEGGQVIYVWSDTHFGHAGIIRHCSRPYDSVEAMNEGLIERWNAAVGPKDTIYLLGDFGFGKDLDAIFARLNGHKHLVLGNHDEKNPAVTKLQWESVRDIVTLREEGVRAVACHYPMETWKSAHKGYLMLHGHSHGTLRRKLPHRFDVGADVFDTPASLRNLASIAAEEMFLPTDHHGDL